VGTLNIMAIFGSQKTQWKSQLKIGFRLYLMKDGMVFLNTQMHICKFCNRACSIFFPDFTKVETEPDGLFQPLSSFYTDKFHISVLAKSDAQIAMHIEESPHTSLGYLITIDPQGTPGVMLELCPGGVRKEDNKCQLLAKSDVIVI
jgi:hypothetical protein